jgi:outer membrane protein OmpA-like peptidoglycan-associated protein
LKSPGLLPGILGTIIHSDDIRNHRQVHVEPNGQTVMQEPGNRTIIKQGDRIAIQHDDGARFTHFDSAHSERNRDGVTETSYVRPDGAIVFSQTDAQGRVLYVHRRESDGRDVSLIDNRRFYAGAAVGGVIGLAIALDLAEPEVRIPRERYIVDYQAASEDDLFEALNAGPVVRIDRAYSLDEIRYNVALRDRMRRIDLDDVTFSTGEADIDPGEHAKLERLAHEMLRVLRHRPNEIFLIEGYTDAVGSDVDNLSLSDRRAETVAQVLTETFNVPPENMVTQGYGEQFLKIDTSGPERANRRVAVRRITPLLTAER